MYVVFVFFLCLILVWLRRANIIVWDMKAFKKPVATYGNVTTLYPTTNAVFSPDEKFVITGMGASSKGGTSKLLFLRREDLSPVRELEMDSAPVKVLWHPKINQVR